MKKLFIVVFALALCSCNKDSVYEKDVLDYSNIGYSRSYSEAEEWAQTSVNLLDDPTTKSGSKREIESWSVAVNSVSKAGESSTDTLFYVFNFANDEGFSIISASNSIQPILAVTESGSYTVGEPTGNDIFDSYVEEMIGELSAQTEYAPVKCFWDESITLGEAVAPKISVTWGQRGIYGQYCSNGISGCAATAIGQIFTYHGAPSSFTVTTDLGDDYFAGDTINLDWTKIRLHKTNHTSSASCDSMHNNIGALLREIGAQVKMEYNTSSSSARYSNVPAAISYFGYVGTINRSPSVAEIKSAIKDYGPVYMRGTMDTLGHAWVVDGYKDYEYYKYHYERLNASDDSIDVTKTLISESHALHINWGWNGDCNGYFAFGVYNTGDADSYDSTSYTLDRNYNINNAIIAVTRE